MVEGEAPTVTEKQVRHAASELFDPEGVDMWLNWPSGALKNSTPLARIENGEGQQVLDLLGALKDGAFA